MYYFDVLGGSVALVVAARIISIAVTPGARWDPTTGIVAAAFVLSVAAVTALRTRAYSQNTPWLTGAFAASATAAIFTFFSSLQVIWFAAVLAAVGSVLVVALVLRTKPCAQPITADDIFKVSALAIGLLLGVICVELLLRVAPGILGPEIRQMVTVDPDEYGVAHPYIGHLHRPNGTTILEGRDFKAVHQVDGNGFRNAWPWPKSAAIVVVGDSLPFGYGAAAAEAWPAIVARERPDDPLINLALIGAGPQQYLRVYETFGLGLRPKLLLVSVFVRNDFWDAEMFDRWVKSGLGGNYVVWRDFGAPGPPMLSVSDPQGSLRSLFDRYVYPRLRTSRVYNLLRAVRGRFGEDVSAAPTVFRFTDGRQVVLLPADFVEKSEMGRKESRAFQVSIDALERIHSVAAANGTHVLIVLQPSKEETYLPLLQRDVPDPAAAVREALDQRGIDYLDLSPGYRERAAAGELLFFEVDGHPNPAGYALSARLVLDHLNTHAEKYGLASRH